MDAVNMDVVIRGRHLELSERFRSQAQAAAEKLDRLGVPLTSVDIEVSHETNPRLSERAYEVEFTCRGRSLVRAEASAADMYTALDRAIDRIEERLRRAAGRRRAGRRAGLESAVEPIPAITIPAEAPADAVPGNTGNTGNTGDSGAATADLPADVVYAEGPVIVREKTHVTSPMTVEQALDAMEAVDHDFFLFHDIETDRVSVVYRRRGYDYGLLRLAVADGGSA